MLSLSHTHTLLPPPRSLLTSRSLDFLPPRSLKAEPNQLVCRNYSAINNVGSSGDGQRAEGPLLSACAAQDAGAL